MSFNLHATLKLQSNSSSHLQISAPTCAILNQEKDFFCDLKEKRDVVIPDTSSLKCLSQNSSFSMNMSACLPNFIKEVQNRKLFSDGANCWGTALHFQGLSLKPKFTWPEEIQYWLESPLCRKVGEGERIESNDILNVFGPEKLDTIERETKDEGTYFWEALYPKRWTKATDISGSGYTGFHRLLHSVVFVSENVVFGKDSPSKLDKFYFHQLQDVYGRTTDQDCQENQIFEPYLREYQKPPKRIKNTKCDYISNVYRCQNMSQYFKNVVLTDDEQVIYNSVEQLDGVLVHIFSAQVKSNFKLSESEKKSLLKLAQTKADEALKWLKTNPSKNKEMLLAKQYFFAQSILNQLKNIN